MIFNSRLTKSLLIMAIISIALSSFPRKNRTRLEHTYVDYYRSNFCPSEVRFNEASLGGLRASRPTDHFIKINLDNIGQDKNPLRAISITFKFFLSAVMYVVSFFALCMILRRLTKFNIKMSEELNSNARNKKVLIFKGIFVALLFLSVIYAVRGQGIAEDVQQGIQSILCSLTNFPDNFSRKDVSTPLDKYSSFHDYHYEAVSLRHLFDEVKRNYTQMFQKTKHLNFLGKIQQIKTSLTEGELKNFTISLSEALQLTQQIKNGSKLMGASINYLRQVLYWVKGCLVFGQSFVNSYYRFQKLPSLGKSIVGQIYHIILFCMAASLLAIAFMNFRRITHQNQIVKGIIFILSFSVMVCLTLSSIGSFVTSVPGALCNLLGEYPNKATLVTKITNIYKFHQQSLKSTLLQLLERTGAGQDGNMAFTNPQIYDHMNKMQQVTKKLAIYSSKDIQAQLISEQPAMEKDIHDFFQYYLAYIAKIQQINLTFDQITKSISKQGDFGRLTLRPFGQYFQYLQYGVCDVNLNAWSRNISNLFYCATMLLAAMGCFLLYLKCKLKTDELSNIEEDSVEMGTMANEHIRQTE